MNRYHSDFWTVNGIMKKVKKKKRQKKNNSESEKRRRVYRANHRVQNNSVALRVISGFFWQFLSNDPNAASSDNKSSKRKPREKCLWLQSTIDSFLQVSFYLLYFRGEWHFRHSFLNEARRGCEREIERTDVDQLPILFTCVVCLCWNHCTQRDLGEDNIRALDFSTAAVKQLVFGRATILSLFISAEAVQHSDSWTIGIILLIIIIFAATCILGFPWENHNSVVLHLLSGCLTFPVRVNR